jgi:dTDP-4-amino-4,6-dideoxygalactose transaminase
MNASASNTVNTVAQSPASGAEIPFFVDRTLAEHDEVRLADAMHQILGRGVFTEGPFTAELERRISAYTGASQAIAVGNASDALVLALLALGVGPGDEVIVPAFTFMASASAVANVGAMPVFVDIDPVTYNTDVSLVHARLTPRTKAIMPVHLFTQMAPMAEIVQLAREAGVSVLEDSAEAIGMFQHGVHAGLHGDLGVLSFFPTKTLGALGDGGMLLVREADLAAQLRSIRSYGRDPSRDYYWRHCGLNSRLDELQAAILLGRLDRLAVSIARRRWLAQLYDALLAPLAPYVQTPRILPQAVDAAVYYVYLVECEARDELVAHLAKAGIGTEIYYPRALHLQAPFAYLGYRSGDFPHAERATKRTVALPLYPDLTDNEVHRVVNAMTTFYQRRGR